jgi:hypothetical protein
MDGWTIGAAHLKRERSSLTSHSFLTTSLLVYTTHSALTQKRHNRTSATDHDKFYRVSVGGKHASMALFA